MPLRKGEKNIGANIRELESANRGKKKKRSKRQILAIALSKARESKANRGGGGKNYS